MEQQLPIEFASFADMLSKLPDDKACRNYLESIFWEGKPTCAHCKERGSYKLTTKGQFKGLYKCKACQQRFTVTAGTIFEGSHIPLRKWFIAIYIETTHKKGISSHQLAKDLGLTQKTAWFMLHRIRTMLKGDDEPLTGIIEADETFVGGKNKNRHKDKKVKNAQGRSFKDKTPVLGLLQRDGQVKTFVVPNTGPKVVQPLVKKSVQEGSVLYSDEWCAYTGLESQYQHQFVDHSRGQYASGDCTTNGIENFWSHLKRGFVTYHHLSAKHLQKYCDEITFRQNNRKQGIQMTFDKALLNANSTLTYQQLIS